MTGGWIEVAVPSNYYWDGRLLLHKRRGSGWMFYQPLFGGVEFIPRHYLHSGEARVSRLLDRPRRGQSMAVLAHIWHYRNFGQLYFWEPLWPPNVANISYSGYAWSTGADSAISGLFVWYFDGRNADHWLVCYKGGEQEWLPPQ